MPRPGDVLRSLAFYFAFYGGSVFIVAACAVLLLLGSHRRFNLAVVVWSGWHRTCARRLLGIKVRTEGVVPSTPVLVTLKHESFFEAIDLTQLLDNPGVFAKAELMQIPVWGMAGRRYGLVEVQREQGAKALRHMLTAARTIIAAGRPLALFPEGTRVPHGEVHDIKSGFAALYKLLDVRRLREPSFPWALTASGAPPEANGQPAGSPQDGPGCRPATLPALTDPP